MEELKVFKNPEFGSLRTVEVNGEPWMVGKDVAVALGYTNPEKAIRNHIDADDKGVNEMDTPRRETEFDHHQREWPLQSGAVIQTPHGKEVSAVGNIGGFTLYPKERRVH